MTNIPWYSEQEDRAMRQQDAGKAASDQREGRKRRLAEAGLAFLFSAAATLAAMIPHISG